MLVIEDILGRISSLPPLVRNNGGGYWNHDFFWKIMGPKGSTQPSGKLAEAIDEAGAEERRGGSRAARIVGTVLAALSVLVLVSNAVMGAFSSLDLVWVGLGVAGIVLAYRPDATEYMRLKAWQRFARR